MLKPVNSVAIKRADVERLWRKWKEKSALNNEGFGLGHGQGT